MGDAIDLIREGFDEGLADLLGSSDLAEQPDIPPEEALRYGREGARRALAPLLWRAAAGPAATTRQVTELLGVTRQALNKRVRNGTLLGLSGERTTWFPLWQFDNNGTVRPVVSEILRAFRTPLDEDVDLRLITSWATTPQPELQGLAPASWIEQKDDDEAVVVAARRAAEAMAQ